MNILLTGGAGYIGSITNWYIRNYTKHKTVIADNLETGHIKPVEETKFYLADLKDSTYLTKILKKEKIDVVIHLAGLAIVSDSIKDPYTYYHNNLLSTMELLRCMEEAGKEKLVFSSSCSVYGNPKKLPIDVNTPLNPISPYARSKVMCEQMINDMMFNYVILRYFNAAGALMDGSIGEAHEHETHIIPNLIKCALEDKPFFLYGDNYKTPDGTCIRDYIHVLDLASAHVKAAELLMERPMTRINCNLSTGVPYSNKQLIHKVEELTGKHIKVEQHLRNFGDPDAVWADNRKARYLLDWDPQYNMNDILESAIKWHTQNPGGYNE